MKPLEYRQEMQKKSQEMVSALRQKGISCGVLQSDLDETILLVQGVEVYKIWYTDNDCGWDWLGFMRQQHG